MASRRIALEWLPDDTQATYDRDCCKMIKKLTDEGWDLGGHRFIKGEHGLETEYYFEKEETEELWT